MEIKNIIFQIIIVTFSLLHNGLATQYTPELILQHMNNQLKDLYTDLHMLTQTKSVTELSNDLELNLITTSIANLTLEAKNMSDYQYRHDYLQKQFQNIKNSGFLLVLGSEYYSKVNPLIDEMKGPAERNILCNFEQNTSCNINLKKNILPNLNYNEKVEKLKHYWIEYRSKTKQNRGAFNQYVEYIKKAADLKRVSPMELWYEKYNGQTDTISHTWSLMEQTKDFYKKLFTVLRFQFNKRYSNSVVTLESTIPHHLMEILFYESRTKLSDYLQWFPTDTHIDVKKPITNNYASKHEAFLKADKFYTDMGFRPLLNKSSIHSYTVDKQNKKTEGPISESSFQTIIEGVELIKQTSECKNDIFDDTSYTTLKYCSTNSFKQLMTLYSNWGKVRYAVHKSADAKLQFSSWNSYNFEDALGEAVLLSVTTSKFIRDSKLPKVYSKNLHPMNRLLRLAIHTLLNIRVNYIHATVMDRILMSQTPPAINNEYWNLMFQHMGIEPPVDRKFDDFDLPYNFYEDVVDNDITRQYYTEILGYQFYQRLCELRGEVNNFKGPTKPLVQCSFSNWDSYKETGKELQRLMSMGSQLTWKESLQSFIQNRNPHQGLDVQPILSYFQPLIDWLDEFIAANKLNTDWKKVRTY